MSALPWETMRARLHAVPGFGGDANKAKRKMWIARALGFIVEQESRDLFRAYHRAGAAELLHVARCLEELERGA